MAGRTAPAKAVPSPRVSESRLVLECCSLEGSWSVLMKEYGLLLGLSFVYTSHHAGSAY